MGLRNILTKTTAERSPARVRSERHVTKTVEEASQDTRLNSHNSIHEELFCVVFLLFPAL